MNNILGNNIKHYRRLNGLTQAALAEKIGISTAYLGRIEIGNDYPSADTMKLIAYYLKIPVDYLCRDKHMDHRIYDKNPLTPELEKLTDTQLNDVMELLRSMFEKKHIELHK